jgi:MATE family multidrug resistance protein
MASSIAPDAPATGLGAQSRALLRLAVPLILSNLAGFAIHMTDVLLMGWYDVTALAGMVLASSFYFIVFITGSGFAVAVMPLVAKAAQEGNATEVRRVTRMGLWLTAAYAAVALPALLLSGSIFAALGQDPEVAAYAARYLAIAGWMIVPALAIAVMRSFLSALEHAGAILWITVGIAVLNALLAYALIFGRWGAPEMGIEGAAWAALVTNSVGALALLAYAVWRLPEYRLLQRLWRVDPQAMGRVFRLGWPISGQLLAEVGLFASSAILVGWVGAVPLAAHGVALQLASLTFMLHLGISQAATVRAGQALGRGDRDGLRQGALAAIALSAGFALATSAAFVLWPEALLGLFIDPADPARPEVLAVGTTLLLLAAVFQLFDGLQGPGHRPPARIQDTPCPSPMPRSPTGAWACRSPMSWASSSGATRSASGSASSSALWPPPASLWSASGAAPGIWAAAPKEDGRMFDFITNWIEQGGPSRWASS